MYIFVIFCFVGIFAGAGYAVGYNDGKDAVVSDCQRLGTFYVEKLHDRVYTFKCEEKRP